MIKIAVLISSALSSAILAWAYADMELPWVAGAMVALLALWWLALWREWEPAPAGLLVAFLGAATLGIGSGVPPLWAVGSAILTLAASDLHAFHLSLRQVARVDPEARLESRHLARTLAISGVALVLSVMSQQWQVRMGTGVALLLGLLAILGLSRGVAFLRRESD